MLHFKNKVYILFYIAVFSAYMFSYINVQPYTTLKIGYDVQGYYNYVPAIFIYKDLSFNFISKIDSTYNFNDNIKNYGITNTNGGVGKLNIYNLGVAVSQLPGFLLAHVYTKYFQQFYPADGYSYCYRVCISISNLLFTLWGLWLLGLWLKKFTTNNYIRGSTVLIIGLGTNLYHYGNFDPGYAHNVVFFLLAAIVYTYSKWLLAPKYIYSITIGLLSGWLVICRLTDAILLVPIFLHFIFTQVKNIKLFILPISIVLITFCFVPFVQIYYWYYASGQWVVNSYAQTGLTFYWHKVRWVKGLFSYKKGWFIYTPVALVACIGLLLKSIKKDTWVIIILLVLAVHIYITFAWAMWFYGASFSCRPLIPTYIFLAIGIVYILEKCWLHKIVRSISVIALLFCITLNLFQSYQYRKIILHYGYMTKDIYWLIWGKVKLTEQEQLLYNKYVNAQIEEHFAETNP